MPEDSPIERRVPADSLRPYSKGQLLKGSASSTQVGGGHYRDLKIQPDEYVHANALGFHEGCAIKYLTRWRAKGGLQDLQKAKHFIDLLIEREGLLPESLGESKGSWI